MVEQRVRKTPRSRVSHPGLFLRPMLIQPLSDRDAASDRLSDATVLPAQFHSPTVNAHKGGIAHFLVKERPGPLSVDSFQEK